MKKSTRNTIIYTVIGILLGSILLYIYESGYMVHGYSSMHGRYMGVIFVCFFLGPAYWFLFRKIDE